MPAGRRVLQLREHRRAYRVRQRGAGTGTRYVPLDQILEQPSTRLLRALRRFDWVQPADLYDAAGFPDYIDETVNPERNAAAAALSRLVKQGHVERGRRQVGGYPHRITASGVALLEQLLRGVTERTRRNRRVA